MRAATYAEADYHAAQRRRAQRYSHATSHAQLISAGAISAKLVMPFQHAAGDNSHAGRRANTSKYAARRLMTINAR